MIALDQLNALAPDAFAAALDGICEHAPWVPLAAAAKRPFATVTALHAALMDVVWEADAATQLRFLVGHPPLSAAAIAANLTPESTSEQAGLGLAGLGNAAERFAQLSAQYEARHGFAFIICARRHTPSSVLHQLEQRLDRDPLAERAAALGEVFFISRLRLVARVDGPGIPATTGTLSVRVQVGGAPAPGLRVELSRDGTALPDGITDAQGAATLVAGEPLRIGPHELLVHVGTPLLGVIPVRLRVLDPEATLDVALSVAPDGYTVRM